MIIEFDPDKNKLNKIKHGLGLARASEMDVLVFVMDERFEEPRFRLYGRIDGTMCCLAGTDRDGVIRVISLRRAHIKAVKRYVSEEF
jgi:uncharacterized protein